MKDSEMNLHHSPGNSKWETRPCPSWELESTWSYWNHHGLQLPCGSVWLELSYCHGVWWHNAVEGGPHYSSHICGYHQSCCRCLREKQSSRCYLCIVSGIHERIFTDSNSNKIIAGRNWHWCEYGQRSKNEACILHWQHSCWKVSLHCNFCIQYFCNI